MDMGTRPTGVGMDDKKEKKEKGAHLVLDKREKGADDDGEAGAGDGG